jgi:uncharacterized membrane protein YfbV (UPF0208 family)
LQSDVVILQREINTLNAQVATLQQQMSAAQAAIVALQTQIDGFTVLGTSSTAAAGTITPPTLVTGYMTTRFAGQNLKIPLYLP